MTHFPPLTTLVNTIQYGNHTLTPRYPSPLLARDGSLYVCSRCITLLADGTALATHMGTCCSRPPFSALYTQPDGISIGRITSHRTKQIAALLAMKFIKSKTLFFEIQSYEIFVAYCRDEVLGYFSRRIGGENSLSCLIVFPCFQKQGLGTLLVDYSYAPRIQHDVFCAISQHRQSSQPSESGVTGRSLAERLQSAVRRKNSANWNGPEKPLSKAAIMCYRKYWKYKVIKGNSIREISERTNMSVDDVIIGLELQGFDFRRWEHVGTVSVEKPRLLAARVIRLVEEESEDSEEDEGQQDFEL